MYDRASRAAYGRHTAPLSLKTVLSGEEHYNVHGFYQSVRPGGHLVVNADQTYESAIDADELVESLCVFFSNSEALDAARARQHDADALLDDPEAPASCVEFPALALRSGVAISALIQALPALRGAALLDQQEHGARLLNALMAEDARMARRGDGLAALRPATRRELLRRCLVARELIEALYGEDVCLRRLAQAAGLSRTHLLRAFRACFGETPGQALLRVRLERAAALIAASDTTISEIALMVGYSDFSAFARAFKRRFGRAPSAYRA